MKISLNGVIRIEDYTQEIVEFLNDNLVIENKEYQNLVKLHLPNYRHIKPTMNINYLKQSLVEKWERNIKKLI